MKDKELLILMEQRKVKIEFSEAEILRMHAVGVLMDGRRSWARFCRKHFTPVAMKLMKERPEYK